MGITEIEALPIRHAVSRNTVAHKLALKKLHFPYREAHECDPPWRRGETRTNKSSRSEDFSEVWLYSAQVPCHSLGRCK